MTVTALTEPASTRRRSWLQLLVVVLLVLIYGALWLAYTANGLTIFGRYQQLAPGASATVDGITYTVKSMTVTRTLVSPGGTVGNAPANTVWVLAELEAVRVPGFTEDTYCSADLIGPQRRTWSTASSPVSRDAENSCGPDDLTAGQPFAYEAIFNVPTRFADQIYGIVLTDDSSSDPDFIIRPPA